MDLKRSKTFHKGKGRVIGMRCRKGVLGAVTSV
jgi:hypothetical protein